MDKDLRFTWISGSVEKIIGVSAEWHYGKSRAEINLTNWDQPNLIDNRAVLERHEPYSDLLQHRQTPLGERWILSNGAPVFDEGGEFAGYFGSGRDVTALQQAEQNNLRFLDAIKKLSEGVALYDAEDRLVICNARYGQLSGATEATLEAGKTFEEILRDNITSGGNPIANDDAEGWLAERLARRREPAGNFEMRHGDYELLINEDRLPDGSVVQTLRDITELKRNEQQLRQSQKMEAIGQLTGGVAHDFNNLLAVMMGNIALLDDELGDGHEYRDLTAPMARAVDQATRLTSRMLAFARLQPLDVGLVDVNALLVGMQPLLGRRLAEEIFVEMQLAPDLEPCIADQGQLEQAILNLAINACDAMPSGGNLIIKTENSDIPSALADDDMDVEPGPYVRITVMDQGHGISAEDQLRIFDPFFTTKEVGKGTGLGLSMVYGFVKQSNGHVTVDSSLSMGAKFHLFLPKGEAERPATAVPEDIAGADNAPGAAILLVEDESEVRTLVERILQRYGFRVWASEDARSGLEILQAHPEIELILTDIMLPGGMNGRQLVDAAMIRNPALKVLFMSGYPKDAIVSQGRLGPDVRLLSKPFKPATLIDHVRDALDNAGAVSEPR
jgi:PAS domain S-box-containing protein